MTLSAGDRLGPYEIVAPLGAGGMGQVFRARDTKLNRDVAIKVLPELFAADADRFARFTREAQTLAALNHPNIAHIHGLEESGDVRALVMELVEGADLSDRIKSGPIPLDEALPIARQIADALEAAHDTGIVHRDLKPANVKVRADGVVKVLDFGLAKAMDPAGSSGVSGGPAPAGISLSPTLTHHATQMGMILGTASYMAPEQARGKAVDRRADVWAFGVVLYEMLTGRRAFDGDEASDVLASVLKSEPDFSALPRDTPASIRRLLRRCLEKDPRKRLSAIGDARLELDEREPALASVQTGASPAALSRRSVGPILGAAVAGAVVTTIVAALSWPSPRATVSAPTQRLSILAPAGAPFLPDTAHVAVSPDGRMVAFVTFAPNATDSQLWVRPLDSTASRRIEGGDGAQLPFWSPDSTRVGFFTRDKLKTVPAAGGRAEVLCTNPRGGGRGAAWGSSDTIVFAPGTSGPLVRVSANGGDPQPLTSLDAAQKELAHRFPAFLPDGEHFLYAALPARGGKFAIFAGSLHDASRKLIGSMESAPVYAPPGYLLYRRQSVLVAQPFDAKTLTLTGEAVSLEDEPTSILDVATSYTASHSTSVSASGTLAYFAAPPGNTVATWLDSGCKPVGTLEIPPGEYTSVHVSPDGSHAVLVRSISPTESSLWVADLARGGASPLTSGPGRNEAPVWSPDGSKIVFASDRDGPQDFFVKAVADPTPEAALYRSDVLFKSPDSWSPDGKWIVYRTIAPDTNYDIWLLPASGSSDPVPYVRGPSQDVAGRTSPDGHWLAYASFESGRRECYVQSFPEPGRKVRISTVGAFSTWWTRDSRQLLMLGLDKTLWRVDVQPGASISVGEPKRIASLPPDFVWMDAMPDRQRFLALIPEHRETGAITVVQNWATALAKKK